MLFFVNPNAGHTEIRNSLMEVLQIFTEGGYDVTVHPTQAPKDLTQTIVSEGSGYDMIVCTGGDGTLNEAVSGLMQLENRPPLGYIPGGTVNDVASTLGLSHNPVTAAQDIINGREFAMDINSFGEDKWFAYVAAFGIFTDVPYATPQEGKRVLGKLAYFLDGAGKLGELKPTHVRVSCSGDTLEDNVLVGLVCSTTSVGGFKVGSGLNVSIDDGVSEIVMIRDIKNLAEFGNAATRLLRGDYQNDCFDTFKTDQIHFSFDKPVSWTLDGEFGGEVQEVDIVNHKKALRIIVPQ